MHDKPNLLIFSRRNAAVPDGQFRGVKLASANIYNLKHVDYSKSGQPVEIIVEGVPKTQTIIFSGTDLHGEAYYFTEQGLRYITDSRNKRPDQRFVLNHFDKVPAILKSPLIIGRNLEKPDNYLYFKEMTTKEHGYRKLLFVAILKKSNINVVWNFYWLRQHKVPQTTEIVYQGKGSAKYLR